MFHIPTTASTGLNLVEATLKWCHMAPTAPDTPQCCPFFTMDPYITAEIPDICDWVSTSFRRLPKQVSWLVDFKSLDVRISGWTTSVCFVPLPHEKRMVFTVIITFMYGQQGYSTPDNDSTVSYTGAAQRATMPHAQNTVWWNRSASEGKWSICDPATRSTPHIPHSATGVIERSRVWRIVRKRIHIAYLPAVRRDLPIPFLRRMLLTSVERNTTRRTVLCYERIVLASCMSGKGKAEKCKWKAEIADEAFGH